MPISYFVKCERTVLLSVNRDLDPPFPPLHQQAGCRAAAWNEVSFLYWDKIPSHRLYVVWIFQIWLALAGNEEVTGGLEPVINVEIF